VDWSAFDAALIRSTWDYHDVVDDFLAWVRRAAQATRLHNPVRLIEWNAHKRYLVDLEAAGLPVVPTALVTRADPESMTNIADRRGWSAVVVKPAVSAGAKATGRYDVGDPAGERALRGVLATGDALVQPYLTEVESHGETSLVVIGGHVTHAVSKLPSTGDFRVQAHFGGAERAVEPTPSEKELAGQALAAVSPFGPVTYARVDCVTVDGQPRLMELEVIEPALYLSFGPMSAADRLIAQVARGTTAGATPVADSTS